MKTFRALLAVISLLVPTVAQAQVKRLDVSDGITAHGSMTLAPSHLLHPSSATILNNKSGQPLYLGKGIATTSTDVADFFFERYANYTGGTSGFVDGAVRVLDNVSAGATAFEWALTSIMDNSSSAADASENVAGYFQAHKRNGGGTWALTAELQDHNANPTTPSVTFEYDLQSKGTDSSNARVIQDMWAKSDDGLATDVTYGLRLNTDAHSTIKHGVYFNGAFIDGVNLSGGTFLSAPLIIGDGTKFCLDALCGGYLWHSSSALRYHTSSGDIASFGDTGTTNLSLVTALSLDASDHVSVASTKKVCLDGSTCSNYLTQSAGTVSIFAGGSSSASFTSTANNLGIVSALSLTSTGAISGTNVTGSGTVQGATVAATGNAQVPTSGKVCLNGSTCTTYISYNGTNINFVIGGTLMASVNATGRIAALNGFDAGGNTGQNCLAGSHATYGGITVTC